MNIAEPSGMLLISHGSPRGEVNQSFSELAGRIASRLGAEVLPAFFSIARPNIPEQVELLVARGVRRVVLMPYFLGSGQHVTVDIPALLKQCKSRYPDVRFELLPTLENEPALEDVIVDRLAPLVTAAALPVDGPAIERRSYEIIDRQLGGWPCAETGDRAVLRRIVHATADVSFARTLRIHASAVAQGKAALAAGKPILCDVKMLQAGITRVENEVLCAIGDPSVRELAQRKNCTRAAAAMEALGPRMDGAIVAIGNAPTALWKVMELAAGGGPRPALVVGLPVGLVGARESKAALLESGLCYITNTSPRGGSPAAAAAVNALAIGERGDQVEKHGK
ncbi:MAG: precorrin-8X methylmutase [Thermoguttaceae bacterium]|jgi:precorrin-8X/cobalt-precorrin-8 methylmutase